MKKNPFKILRNYGALMFTVAVLFSSCSSKKKTPQHIDYIPENATAVISVDIKEMVLKSFDLEVLLSEKFFREMGFSPEEAKEYEKKSNILIQSGIDILNTAYVVYGNAMQEDDIDFSLVLPIDNSERFKNFLSNKDFWEKETWETGSNENFNFGSNKHAMVAWNEEAAVFLQGPALDNAEIQALLKKYFNKEKPLLKKNESFKMAQSNPFDMNVWGNAEQLLKKSHQTNLIDVKKLEDTFVNLSLLFEKGKATANLKAHLGKHLEKDYHLIFGEKQLSDMAKKIPIQDHIGLLGMSFNLEAIQTLIQENQPYLWEDLKRNYKKDLLGLSLDELCKMLSGNAIIIMKDLSKLDFVIALELKDKSLLERVLEQPWISKKGAYYELAGGLFGNLLAKDNMVYIVRGTNSEEVITAILEGKSTQDDKTLEVIEGNNIALVAKKEILREIPYSMEWHHDVVDEILFTSGKIEKGQVDNRLVFMMKNKEENALISIINGYKGVKDYN